MWLMLEEKTILAVLLAATSSARSRNESAGLVRLAALAMPRSAVGSPQHVGKATAGNLNVANQQVT